MSGRTREPEFLTVNPSGQVPAVVLEDGRPLSQSNAILVHFAEDTDLVPADHYERSPDTTPNNTLATRLPSARKSADNESDGFTLMTTLMSAGNDASHHLSGFRAGSSSSRGMRGDAGATLDPSPGSPRPCSR